MKQQQLIKKQIAKYKEILSLCHAYQNQQHLKGQIDYLENLLNMDNVETMRGAD